MENIAIGLILAALAVLSLSIIFGEFVNNQKIIMKIEGVALVLLLIGISALFVIWNLMS